MALAAAAIAFAVPEVAGAEEEPLELITDRPDFTESSSAVAPGHVQLEMGAEYSSTPEGHSLSLPLLLVRVGVVENLELRLGVPSLLLDFTDRAHAGAGGVELGGKVVFPIGEMAAVGLMPFVAIPITPGDFSGDGVTAGGRFVWAVDATDWLAISGNLGAMMHGLGGVDADLESELLASLSLGFGLTDRLGIFLEGFASFFLEGDPVPSIDGGFTFLVTPTIQLDAYAGWSYDDGSQGFGGLGVSLLI